WILPSPTPLILHTNPRLLIVTVTLIVGAFQIVVAHALDSSYTEGQIQGWWHQFHKTMQSIKRPGMMSLSLIDANCTLGAVQSPAIGPANPDIETTIGSFVHHMLKSIGPIGAGHISCITMRSWYMDFHTWHLKTY
ncbi:MAG: hypothetical protein ACKPKO_41960, partial [Candidatus Fonsibacter sp.]